MILISHRGNIHGKIPSSENHPDYIDRAIKDGYDVEIDIRYIDNKLYLGHDTPDYLVTLEWLEQRQDKLWVHCKNHEVIEFMNQTDLNWFWHDEDDITITSDGFIWCHPKIQPIKNSIAVLPDGMNWDLSKCIGICSDYIQNYKK